MPDSILHGGLDLDGHKQRSTAQPIRALAGPRQAIVPLDQHIGRPAIALVAVGERVLKGQAIARPDGEVSAWLHAPISGTVTAVEPQRSVHRPNAMAPTVVIANDEREATFEHQPMLDGYPNMSGPQLCEHIERGGLVGLGGAGFPTAAKLSRSSAAEDLHLLLNGAECEPYISCDDMLMRERAQDVVLGASILRHACGASRCTIALENDTPEAERAIRAAIKSSRDTSLHLAIVANLYPAGGERQLIAAVFGIEVPTGGLPADIGVVCQNVATAVAAARWVRDGEPLISRIVTVTGMGVREPRNVEARLGTPVSDLIAACGGYADGPARLIMGGSMMGLTLPSDTVPVIKATNCILAAAPVDLQPRAPEMPCIRCGNCSQVCPARLLPQQLHWYLHPPELAALDRLGLLDCIECGCCDYVCPSQIPLAARFSAAKPALIASKAANAASQAARERFENRTERLTRLESERRAKLAAKRRQVAGEKP